MKSSIFETTYTKVQALHKAYQAADDAGKTAIRDSYKALMKEFEALGAAACRIWRDYETSRDCGNEYLDINDVVWDKDVESLISCMREHGIEKFTFSSSWSSAVETAWLFTENGCELGGLVEVNGSMNYFAGEHEKKHGYLFKVN